MSTRAQLRLADDPRPDALAGLTVRWREVAATLRRYGDVRGAELVDLLAGEADAALRGICAAPVRPTKTGERNPEPDRLLTVVEAAARLGVSPGWVHRHWREALRGCARKLGSRTLRFSAQRLDEHLQTGEPLRR